MCRRNKGALNVVGIGYQLAGHITAEALALIRGADKLFFLVPDPIHEKWLRRLNVNAISMSDIARDGMSLIACCNEMVRQILLAVRAGLNVCAAFSGHPAIAVSPAHEALRRVQAEGFRARMFPAVSAMDCLFADLEVDPAEGCQVFEAESLLQKNYRLDPQSCLILFQPGVVGLRRVAHKPHSGAGMARIARVLQRCYGSQHQTVIYEAATLPVGRCRAETVSLAFLSSARLTPASTLYVPPVPKRI